MKTLAAITLAGILGGCMAPSPVGQPHLVLQGGSDFLEVHEAQKGLTWQNLMVSVSPPTCQANRPSQGEMIVGQHIQVSNNPEGPCYVAAAYAKHDLGAWEFFDDHGNGSVQE